MNRSRWAPTSSPPSSTSRSAPPWAGARLDDDDDGWNPFLATELLRSLVEDGQVEVDRGLAELVAGDELPGAATAPRDSHARRHTVATSWRRRRRPGGVTADGATAIVELEVGAVLAIALTAVDSACSSTPARR